MSTETSFDVDSFERCLDVHGHDLSRWPADDRERGRELLATSREAQLAHDAAVRFARMLDEVEALEPSAALLKSVAEIPARHPRSNESRPRRNVAAPAAWWPFEGFLRPALAMVATVALGVMTGTLMTPAEGQDRGEASAFLSELEGDELVLTDREVDELSELAFAWHLEDSGWEEWP